MSIGLGTDNLFRVSPSLPLPFASLERVNNESLRSLERSRSSLALDALFLAALAALAGDNPPIIDLSITTYSLVPVKSSSPVTTIRSGPCPATNLEPRERGWLAVEGRLDLVLEDLSREGPGSLLATLKLLSRVRRGGMDFGLPNRGAAGEKIDT